MCGDETAQRQRSLAKAADRDPVGGPATRASDHEVGGLFAPTSTALHPIGSRRELNEGALQSLALTGTVPALLVTLGTRNRQPGEAVNHQRKSRPGSAEATFKSLSRSHPVRPLPHDDVGFCALGRIRTCEARFRNHFEGRPRRPLNRVGAGQVGWPVQRIHHARLSLRGWATGRGNVHAVPSCRVVVADRRGS